MTVKTVEVFFHKQEYSFRFPEAISVFGFSISFYGILLVLAAVAGILVSYRETKKKQGNIEQLITLLTIVIVAGLLGARVYYAMFHWSSFAENPLSLINLRSGGLSYLGALFGAWGAVGAYCHRKKIQFADHAGSLGLGAAVAAPFVWIGCVLIREPLGRFCDSSLAESFSVEHLPKSTKNMDVTSLMKVGRGRGDLANTYPVALLGLLLSILFLVVLFLMKGRVKKSDSLFYIYLALNCMGCIVIEQFRLDRCYIWGTTLCANQIIAVAMLLTLIGTYVWKNWLWRKKTDSVTENK